MADFKDKVVYQIYPKSFRDSNGDGIGDLPGIIEKLDYLKMLGVDYLWITPFFPSPQRDNGYDVSDYTAVDPRFGTMEDFEQLIREAENRQIGIMLDMVFNHTSTEHEWFQKALAGEEKYQNYYIWREGSPDRPPTNWESKFGGPAWEYVPALGKWYLHLFDVTQADLNWENPEVREELKNVIRFWKQKGVRGFRFDVVNLISKPEIFEDDPEGDGRRFYTDGHHVHGFLKELVRDTQIEDMVTVGEMSSTTLENCIRYSNPEEKELSMCFNFHHLKIDYKDGNKWALMEPDRKKLKKLFQVWQEGMQQENGWNAVFWCNHDQPRIVTRLGDEKRYWKESAKMLAACIHLMRGTPYIYQGEELGMTNAHYTTIEKYQDVESLNYYKILLEQGKTEAEALEILAARSRDNSRSPMQWSSEPYAGFSDVQPWISLPDNWQTINVQTQLQDETSIMAFYRRLISLRKSMRIISEGTIHFLPVNEENIIAYERRLENEHMAVFCNLSSETIRIEQSVEGISPELSGDYPKMQETAWEPYRKILGNYDETDRENGSPVLKPYEVIALYRC
ncbi:MAG: alpha,alpha-phosphotrehalase [Lachnospiraceae bacterium]|nr:alpha,alpha-phosphotrehalase [Lachnospiraceae bacterium]